MLIGICEDQEEIRSDLRRKIEAEENSLSFQIIEFTSGEAMLETTISFDLVFLDIELMGRLSGLEVAQKLQQRLPELILVFVSSYAQYVSDAFHLHTFQFLLKPINETLFHKEFLRCIKHYQSTHELFHVVQNGEIIELKLKEIVYIESDKRKLYIHVRDGKIFEMYGKISEQQKN